MSSENSIGRLQNTHSTDLWNGSELIALFSPEQLNTVPQTMIRDTDRSVCDFLANRIWQGNIPASDQFEFTELREREIQIKVSGILNDYFITELAEIIKQH